MSCVLWRIISNSRARQIVIASLVKSFSVKKQWLVGNRVTHEQEYLGAGSWEEQISLRNFLAIPLRNCRLADNPSRVMRTDFLCEKYHLKEASAHPE